MPKGEATREGIESLMVTTASIVVVRDDIGAFIPPFVQTYEEDDRTAVFGVVLQCLDTDGNETGRMIAQIRAVTTKAEEDEADRVRKCGLQGGAVNS